MGLSLQGLSSTLSSSCSMASAWPYTEAWPGLCSGAGSAPVWDIGAGTQGQKGPRVYSRQRQILVLQGFPFFHFSPFSVFHSQSCLLSGC